MGQPRGQLDLVPDATHERGDMETEITKDEFNRYQWTKVGSKEFVRGVLLVDPPDDGYEYVDVTTYGDAIQRWERAVMVG